MSVIRNAFARIAGERSIALRHSRPRISARTPCNHFSSKPLSHGINASQKRHKVGVTFDIDGVLVRGSQVLPNAKRSMQRLVDADVPFLLLTNGGGETEAVKAAKLSETLGFPIHPQQVVLSHTPLRPVIQQYANKKILVLGCRDVKGVARAYGATRVFDIPSLLADEPLRYPFYNTQRQELPAHEREEPFTAVFILHDPTEWAVEIQITMDVIKGGWPLGSGGHKQSIPVYSSNPDLIFAGLYPVPRVACGAFTHCLKSLWKQLHGSELHVTQCGKPTRMTFDFAYTQLGTWHAFHHHHHYYNLSIPDRLDFGKQHADVKGEPSGPGMLFDHLFHIGDNPAADMAGTRNAGHPWKGILVQTGVFQDKHGHKNDLEHPGHVCVHGVGEAVDVALSHV